MTKKNYYNTFKCSSISILPYHSYGASWLLQFKASSEPSKVPKIFKARHACISTLTMQKYQVVHIGSYLYCFRIGYCWVVANLFMQQMHAKVDFIMSLFTTKDHTTFRIHQPREIQMKAQITIHLLSRISNT